MLFNTPVFAFLFLPLVLAVYLIAMRWRAPMIALGWLAGASVVFYGYWDPSFLPLLIGSILLNYGVGRLLDTAVWRGSAVARRRLLIGAVIANLSVLALYKYANFAIGSVRELAGVDLPVLDIVLPIGISFYTFTQIAYLVDAHRDGRSERSLTAYVLFVTFFPHLIAGPVLHHAEMMPQFLDERRRVDLAILIEGLFFFVGGLAKKVLLADSVAPLANRAFTLAESAPLGWVDSWAGALAYTVQIYFDFSGYSDMAIGLGLLFGIRLPLNFDSPYRCRSIIDFWRCWHMTLSRFLRDYLYIPLGGNRHGPVRRQVNLMLTMLLGGLWHGAAWTFVVWGGLHGLFLQINHAWRHALQRRPALAATVARHPRAGGALAWLLTMLAVVVAWVFFRADSFTAALNLLRGMFLGHGGIDAGLLDARGGGFVLVGLLLAVGLRNSQAWFTGIGERLLAPGRLGHPDAARGALVGCLLLGAALLVLISAGSDSHEFIYFNF